MPTFSFQLDVRDPPAKVIGAMVDFSERRPEIWPNLTGSRIYNHYDRRSTTLLRRLLGAMFHLSGGAPIERTFRQVYGRPT